MGRSRKSGAEMAKDFRKKLQADAEKYNSYKAKDKEIKRAERKSGNVLSPGETATKKKLNRDRVRKCRLKKREKNASNQYVSQAYKTPQALGKAVGKVKKHLPHSPRKRKAVVLKLADTSGFCVVKKKCTLRGNKGLPSETVKLVKDFFLLDSVSRQTPGRRDFVTVKQDNNKRQHIQKRHLLWSLNETYAIFVKENPSVPIGFSKFCSLRPVNVMLSAEKRRRES